MNASSQGFALVTGGSSGIGALYAERLARRGKNLILVARDAANLEATAARIAQSTGRQVRTVVAELTDPAELRQVEALLREDAGIDMLVNNAGVGAVAPLLESDVERMAAMLDINVKALMRLSYAAAPGFVQRGQGTIVNIASTVAISTEVLNGVYAASKAFVLAFTQSLQHELAPKGLRIQVVVPGITATNFWNAAGLPHSHLPQDWVMAPELMVDAALAGLDQGEVVTIPPLHDAELWTRYEELRQQMSQQFGQSSPAARYGVGGR